MSHRNEYGMITMTKQQYEDAVRIAAEVEREACAQTVESKWHEARDTEFDLGFETARKCFAAALRSRKK